MTYFILKGKTIADFYVHMKNVSNYKEKIIMEKMRRLVKKNVCQ